MTTNDSTSSSRSLASSSFILRWKQQLLLMTALVVGLFGRNGGCVHGRVSFFSQRLPRRTLIPSSSAPIGAAWTKTCAFVSHLPRGGAGAADSTEASSEPSETSLERTHVEHTSALGETRQAEHKEKEQDDETEHQSLDPQPAIDTIQLNTTTGTVSSTSYHHQNVTMSVDNSSSNATTSMTANSSSITPMPLWKQALPPILQKKKKNLVKINWRLHKNDNNDNDVVEIYLLGTAHVSNDSSADVRALLQAVQPHCIFVELCEARIPLLTAGESPPLLQQEEAEENMTNTSSTSSSSTVSFWDRWQGIQQSQGGSKMQALTSMLLTSVQEDYAETLGVELGGEFRAAHEYWKRAVANKLPTLTSELQQYRAMMPITGPPFLVLGDRPVQLTMLRAWESLWWWPKIKVMLGLLWSSLICKPKEHEIRAWLQSVLEEHDNDDDNKDLLTESMAELRQHFPSLYTTIIEERDAWLAAKLVQTCRAILQQQPQMSTLTTKTSAGYTNNIEPHQRRKRPIVVAIVGAGHVPGICAWLTAPPTLLPKLSRSAARTTSTGAVASPEEILLNLTQTKRWAKDEMVQNEMIPQWVEQVTQLQDNQDWMWAAAASASQAATLTIPSISRTESSMRMRPPGGEKVDSEMIL